MSESEIDIEALKNRIRAAADARRVSNGDLAKIDPSNILRNLQSRPPAIRARAEEPPPAKIPPPSLQPLFTPRPDKRYHVNDLLRYHDKEFVRNAYRAVLRREPDDEGYEHTLDGLRGGRFTKMDILTGLRFSPEGRDKNVHLEGLPRPIVRRLYRLPALGYVLQLLVGLKSLPILMRHQSQFEAYTQAQHQLLLDHVSQVFAHLAGDFAARLTRLSDEAARQADAQRDGFTLQREQVGALFREHHELTERQRRLEEEIYALLEKVRAADVASSPEPSIEEHRLAEFYASFEGQFRGDAETIKGLLRFYLPHLSRAGVSGDVLDLGCGRGGWLELLREEGIGARGVDSNPVLIDECEKRGLEVVEGDLLEHLRQLPDESLGAITAFHVIEHMPFVALLELLDEVWRTLRPGGIVMFETPSPENLVVSACNFYSDPTHVRPVFPHTLHFALKHRGFTDTGLYFLHPVEGSPFEQPGMQSLHMWFYGPRDYAAIGRKPVGESPRADEGIR